MRASREPSPLVIAAGLAVVFGTAVAPAATAPALLLAGALSFAGLRRVALLTFVLLVLTGTAGLRVDQANRPSVTSSPAAR